MDNRGLKRSVQERSANSRNLLNTDPKRLQGSGTSTGDAIEYLDGLESEHGYTIAPYVKKLYNMMVHNDRPDIISWNSLGDTIIIKDKKKFENEILTKFFGSNKFDSFKRQMAYYQFRKLSDHDENITFSNPDFRRDQADLLHKLERVVNKGKGSRDMPKLRDSVNSNPLSSSFGVPDIETAKRIMSLEHDNAQFNKRVQLLEHENTLLHQTLCAITERLNRMEHQQQQQQMRVKHAQSMPPLMPSSIEPTPVNISSTAAPAPKLTPPTSSASQPPRPPLSFSLQDATPPGRVASTTGMDVECKKRNLQREDSFAVFIKRNITEPNNANANTRPSKEEMQAKKDSFNQMIGEIENPNPKRYHDYSTEELQEFTDSYRKIIEWMEKQKYSSRSVLSAGVASNASEDQPNLVQRSNRATISYPVRGNIATVPNTSCANVFEDMDQDEEFIESLFYASTDTVPITNVSDSSGLGDGSGNLSPEDVDGADVAEDMDLDGSRRELMSGFRQFSL